jgi:hypothetical protein
MVTCIQAPFVREELGTTEVSDLDAADVEENRKPGYPARLEKSRRGHNQG